MNGRILLDTNVIIALWNGDKTITTRLNQAEEVFIAIPVLGELYFGARKSSKIKANLALIDDFANENTVLTCELDTAKEYGIIKNQLEKVGKPIPENDIWIAAIAKQYNLILLTRDEHFKAISDLQIEFAI